MTKLLKGLLKIIIIFFAFFLVLNLAEHLFDMELDSYTIVIIFIVVVSSTGIFNNRKIRK